MVIGMVTPQYFGKGGRCIRPTWPAHPMNPFAYSRFDIAIACLNVFLELVGIGLSPAVRVAMRDQPQHQASTVRHRLDAHA
jgi:hypothetical protein